MTLLLENHSDFTAAEYRVDRGRGRGGSIGVFLDLVNPIAALDDPVPVIEALAPLARAGHVKDYVFRSMPTDDGYHRRGFEVLYRYPGEGVADLPALIASALVAVSASATSTSPSRASTTARTSTTSGSGSAGASRCCGSWSA